MAIGVAFLFLAYHLGVWIGPRSWTVLQVPREKWWLLVIGVVILIAGSLVLDRFDGRADKSSD